MLRERNRLTDKMRAPGNTHRLSIIGRTGSGKTIAGAWHLSRASYDVMPWIILDYKRDTFLNSINAKELDVSAKVPKRPGVYIIHPMAQTDDDAVERLLWRIWQRGKTGLFVDEGYMVGNENPAFRALLTQGRSKYIPMIYLSQRPVYMDRFAFSEADFYQVFHLNDRKDQVRVGEFLHNEIDLKLRLDRYNSWWHDVSDHNFRLLGPVPRHDMIRATFRQRLGIRRRTL